MSGYDALVVMPGWGHGVGGFRHLGGHAWSELSFGNRSQFRYMTSFIKSHANIGVYVDAANISRNGGQRMQYDVLRKFACRDYAEALRLNVYLSYDGEKAETNLIYRDRARAYQSALREIGYKVIEKRVKWFEDELGNRFGKANADLDMAVDVLLQSENLDRVLLVTGDGDFVQVVRALQNKRCRVEGKDFRGYELYDHVRDPHENVNVADDPNYAGVRRELIRQLQGGWRAALPPGVSR